MIIGLYFIRKDVSFDVKGYVVNVISRIVVTIVISAFPVALIAHYCNGWIQLIITGIASTLLVCGSVFFVIMSRKERNAVIIKVKNKVCRHSSTITT